MKFILATLLTVTFASGFGPSLAHAESEFPLASAASAGLVPGAGETVIPNEIATTVEEAAEHIRSLQMAELVLLDAQQKYFEILRASFEGSRALSQAFDSKRSAQTGVSSVSGGVMVVMDAYLARMWLSGATPSAMVIKDLWMASRGETGRLSAIGSKTWQSITALGRSLKIPKNYVSTAALGVFAYVQVENFFVINMSEAQYRATIRALDVKISKLKVEQAKIADTYTPISAR